MKLKNKNLFINLAQTIICIIVLTICIQGCSSDLEEFDSDSVSINTTYLDFDVQSNTKFNSEQLEILSTAIERASNYLKFDGESYVFELNSPSQINISRRLFEYIYPSMNDLVVSALDIPRLKFDSEFYSTLGYNQYTMNLNHYEALEYYQMMSSSNNYGATASSIAAGALHPGVSAAIGIGGLINSEIISNRYNQYVNSGSTGGIRVIVTNTFTPNIPGCYIRTTQVLNR